MTETVLADVLYTLRCALIFFAFAWAVRGLRGTLRMKLNWHAWASILAVGVVLAGGYSCWRWWNP